MIKENYKVLPLARNGMCIKKELSYGVNYFKINSVCHRGTYVPTEEDEDGYEVELSEREYVDLYGVLVSASAIKFYTLRIEETDTYSIVSFNEFKDKANLCFNNLI